MTETAPGGLPVILPLPGTGTSQSVPGCNSGQGQTGPR